VDYKISGGPLSLIFVTFDTDGIKLHITVPS
jgi:hypothetical protein